MSKRSVDGDVIDSTPVLSSVLTLAGSHAQSLRLCDQVSALAAALPRGVTSCREITGVCELVVHAGAADGYGIKPWRVHVGGVGPDIDAADIGAFDNEQDHDGDGVGSAAALAAILAAPALQAPVAVRFAEPIFSRPGVDDAGCVDGSFWRDLGNSGPSNIGRGVSGLERVTLRDIGERLVEWLERDTTVAKGAEADGTAGACALPTAVSVGALSGGCECNDWEAAQRHTANKVRAIDSYRKVARSQSLFPRGVGAGMADKCSIDPMWLCEDVREIVFPKGVYTPIVGSAALSATSLAAWRKLADEVSPGIFSFPLFTDAFCDMMVNEIDSFEATELPRRRPNTMNNFGLILNEIGMEQLMSSVNAQIIAPLARALFPTEAITEEIDHHHSFIVEYQYQPGGDRGLDMHHDASEVTLNVCLGRDFTGAKLQFCGREDQPDRRRSQHTVLHKKGTAVFHRGRHRHGADDIESGTRLNLIMWGRSSAFRNAAAFGHVLPDGYPRLAELDGVPDVVCLSKKNDDDYAIRLQQHLDAVKKESSS